MTKKELQIKYNVWRNICEELIAAYTQDPDNNYPCSSDCGEAAVREDFSDFAGLKKQIEFEKMFELERNYDLVA